MGILDKLLTSQKPRTPADVAAKLCTALEALSTAAAGRDEKAQDRAHESCAKYLAAAKLLCFGDEEHEASKAEALALAAEAARTDVLALLVKQLAHLEFECRKDAAQVFGALVRIKDGESRGPGAEYILAHREIPTRLFNGCAPGQAGMPSHRRRLQNVADVHRTMLLWRRYDDITVALNFGAMLRDCVRDEALAR
jgi:calcium binding protein 39